MPKCSPMECRPEYPMADSSKGCIGLAKEITGSPLYIEAAAPIHPKVSVDRSGLRVCPA